MTHLTEEYLDVVKANALKGDAQSEYELGSLFIGDYFKQRAIYTIRALFKGALMIYNSALNQTCQNTDELISGALSVFREKPSNESFQNLIAVTLQSLTELKPAAVTDFTSALLGGFSSLAESVVQIVNRHYPECRSDEAAVNATESFETEPTLDKFYQLIDVLADESANRTEDSIGKKLLASAALKGVENAAVSLSKLYGYNTWSATIVNGNVAPMVSSANNIGHPSIPSGFVEESIYVDETKNLSLWRMVDFFTADVNKFNHFISFSYNQENQTHREAAAACVSTVLGAMLAWIGPSKFKVDIVDFEHTGIGAYPSSFLSEKQVKLIVREDEWGDALGELEQTIEKRARIMHSIFDYNSRNEDSPELYRVVVIQDYSGALVNAEPLKSEHPDPKEKIAYEKRVRNANRLRHLLERGYRFGIFFVIASSKDKYRSSLGEFYCNGITYPRHPYDVCRVDGLDAGGDDWLMKWLAGGEEIKRRNVKATANEQDGSSGVIITDLTDDGNDVEFRFDTVSHTHTFIIGKTGSGKSVLLHNIITGLVNRYSPEDLELYLLDLKMGGVEFNRYRKLPHLRFLLVDNSDIQIVLEIMRDIDRKMRERGKVFRDAAVSNIKEYNVTHPENKMSQVIVIIDECHQIFSMGNDRGSAKYQREITERLAKIAKEGRSQGIHLVFATQTLSGSEIPPDIQKNITDYYLLKCAPSDSETLVRGSSGKTESLPVGKVYYHHADRQSLFQGIYNDNQALDELIRESSERFKDSKSNGQFYFNGAQIFTLDKEAILTVISGKRRGIYATPGKQINLMQQPVELTLTRDYGENILLTGINAEEQLSRTTMALLISQLISAKEVGENLNIEVINCLDAENATSRILAELSSAGMISLYTPSESGNLLSKMCNNIKHKSVDGATIIYVFGQERFVELKRDQKLIQEDCGANADSMDLFSGIGFSSDGTGTDFGSYRKAMIYILENGPTENVHMAIQVDKSDKLLFEDFYSAKIVKARFKHIIVLRTELRLAMQIGLSDEINIDKISEDTERLRAYYYNDENDSYTLFSPFGSITNINQLKTLQ